MERVDYVIWLLIAFMFGITVGLYYASVAARRQLKETMVMMDHFVMQRFSE